MSYKFTFDLTKLSKTIFKDIAESIEKEKLPHKVGDIARKLVKKFNVNKIIGLPVGDSIKTMIQDTLRQETILR